MRCNHAFCAFILEPLPVADVKTQSWYFSTNFLVLFLVLFWLFLVLFYCPWSPKSHFV